ncbi:hypothetical protein TNCV_1345091 [Trichonephila clavipes]|nr:hypothetical protein TNCV_1345091 [Trichonephila clavipes]
MQANIIKTAHERRHFVVLRTQDLVSKDFYIPRLKDKVEKCIHNCVTCILTNRKRGKQDGMLNPMEKDDLPLHTFHLDHLGPLATTSKKYKHVLAVIDASSKFIWLYPTRSTDAAEAINRLENQRHVFGNPARIITDKGSAFTSSAFEDYWELWFQQDGTTCHTARATVDLLKDTFGDCLISRFGLVNWPPRSCDLTPLDYFLWGYVKSLVCADKPQTLDHLEDNIRRVIADIRPQMLEKVIENWTSRLDYIRASRGSPMPEIIFKICQVIYSQFGLAIHQNDHKARRRFVEWAQNEIAVVPDFHKRILFSDEAHFWLNGYVNKQNCRICSEANPQVYVETPLHPEKLTVWCALWAGGILLQKR